MTISDPDVACPDRSDLGCAETEALSRARAVLDGLVITPTEALRLAKSLRHEVAYAQAREIAKIYRAKTEDDALAFELLRVEMTSTYKDPEIATDKGLCDAWQMLIAAGYRPDRLRTDTAEDKRRAREVSGLAGAIKKRLWDYDGRVGHLQESARIAKGYGDTIEADEGYQAINRAFVLDLMTSLEPKTNDGPDPSTAATMSGSAFASIDAHSFGRGGIGIFLMPVA